MEFILCVIQYVLIAIVIAAIGGLGAFIGINLRKAVDKSKARKAEMAEKAEE